MADLNNPTANWAIGLFKRSIYQSARSSDILMQELENHAMALWEQDIGIKLKPKAQIKDSPSVPVLKEVGRL